MSIDAVPLRTTTTCGIEVEIYYLKISDTYSLVVTADNKPARSISFELENEDISIRAELFQRASKNPWKRK